MKMKSKEMTTLHLRKSIGFLIPLAFVCLALSASSGVALADGCIGQTNWIDSNGNWFTRTNWDNGVPTASAAAFINAGNANIDSTGAVACDLFLGFPANYSGSVSIAGGSLTVGNEVEVGGSGTGKLTITNGGTVSAGLLTIAALSSASAGTVSISGSTFTIGGRCDVGGDNQTLGGVALLSVTSGGSVSAGNVHAFKSGTLTGNGTITTTNGTTIEGTLEPSGTPPNDTLTISSGDLTFCSSSGCSPLMECNVVPVGADNVNVSNGGASLSGKISVSMSGTFTPGTTYTLLHAAGGLGFTTFSSQSITFPPGQNFTPVIQYDYIHNNVNLYLQPNT
jgi:T5SS/PEP-CTERM-associated repeat protein